MPDSRSQIIHLIPKGVLENTYHGSFKDVISRVRLFRRSSAAYQQIILDGDKPQQVFDQTKTWESPFFLVEYSYYPRIVRTLRKQFPKSFIAVRSHNIEPMQHLNNYGWWSAKGPVWLTYGMARLFWGDVIVKRHADVIYSISDWERRTYWQRMPGSAEVQWLPYFCPEHLIAQTPEPSSLRKTIACMPTSVKSRKSLDLVSKFIKFAETAKQCSSEYEFVITGDLQAWPAPQSDAVRYTGMIGNLGEFLGSVKAVCILSDLGYGFKTTIADAMANGVEVLVHERLKKRFASMLGDTLIAVDSSNPASVHAALQRLSRGGSSLPEINRSLQTRSKEILNHDFRLDLEE